MASTSSAQHIRLGSRPAGHGGLLRGQQVPLPHLPFVIHLSGFQRCIPATTLMSVVSDMPLPILYPRKSGGSCCFITNGFRRQPDWPPVELAAGLVHTIIQITCHAWASPSARCLHPYFCCFQSLTLCVFFSFCLYNPWCCSNFDFLA